MMDDHKESELLVVKELLWKDNELCERPLWNWIDIGKQKVDGLHESCC